ncbi:TonB-dependent siderophore receptor [Amorphus sp. 3PC139-8]|uniref:TonB-dependent siderophore receptor n=1 Tax=Amorphus sp. 3PC139-8 TaxID=2735676 RepID=UPI00345CA7A5
MMRLPPHRRPVSERTLLLVGGLILLFGNAASAQQDAAVLDQIEISAERADGPVNGYVARQSSTASMTGTPILETPQSVSVVGRQELDDRQVQTTTEALQYVPGVFASTSAVSRRFDYFSIRGFDATLSGMLLDGLRSTTAQSYVRYQPYGMERAEVLRGPTSFLYGPTSLGGAVNMISKRPTRETRREIGIQTGSYDRKQLQFDLSGPLNDDEKLFYRLVGVGRLSDTQFDYVPDDTAYVAPSFTWAPDDLTSLTVLASYTHDVFGPPRPYLPIQGTLLPNPNGELPWNTYLDGSDLHNSNTQANLGYEFDHAFDERWSFHSAARYTRNELTTQTLSGMGLASDMRTLNRTAYQFGIVGDILSTDNHATVDWGTGEIEGTSVFGVSYRHTKEDYYLDYGRAPSVDIYNPTYGTGFYAGTPFTRTKQTGNELGLYTENTVTLMDRLVLDLAGRQDWAWVDTDDLLTNTSANQDDNAFTYRAGLSYLTPFGIAPYASYTTSFLPVLGTNFYGEPYKPTTGEQVEIGVKYEPETFDALFTAAWFHLAQNDVLTADPNNPLNTIQTGQVTSRGVELSASVNVTEAFRLVANYTYLDQEVTESTDPVALGNRPTGEPEHMASVWADYELVTGPLRGFGFGAGLRYIGSSYADTANTITVPDTTLVDAALRYDFGKQFPDLDGLQLSVNATNLFDEHYYTSCSARSCSEGYDRSIIGTLSYRW